MFTWSPTADQRGTNLLTVRVTDNGTPPLSATANSESSWKFPTSPGQSHPIADVNVPVGQVIAFRVIGQDQIQRKH